VNLLHRRYCGSGRWAHIVRSLIVPSVLGGVDVGDEVLEVGPGPGRTTEVIRHRVGRLTALEVDGRLAGSLGARLRDSNVAVVRGDGTVMPFPDATFTGAVCLTMLHHVPSAELQDRLLSEVCRVLRPGGVLAGCDSAGGALRFRLLHVGDTLVPVDPAGLPGRLERAGFADVVVQRNGRVRFRARRPLR
jgi:ubiquinone/menaquinone biosynthesis C-methylase UbiE